MTKDTESTSSGLAESVLSAGLAKLPPRAMHFVSDIHGEAAAFTHLVRSRSGSVREVLERSLSGAASPDAIARLLEAVYYPEVVCDRAHAKQLDTRTWWLDKIGSLAMLVSLLGRDYPQAQLTGAAAGETDPSVVLGQTGCPVPEVTCQPQDAAALERLVGWSAAGRRGEQAFDAAVEALIAAGQARTAMCTLAFWVRRLCSGASYMLGDIWDRGAHGDDVMDQLMQVPEVAVVWGNHDICWMGAAAGDPCCIATLLRNNIKYGNTAQFEEGYGISLEALRAFGQATYKDEGEKKDPLYKAISVLLFKSEGQAIRRHPEWHMDGRLLLDKMDLTAGTVPVDGVDYALNTCDFPTVDLGGDAYAFTAEEARVMDGLVAAFTGSARLQRQIQWLYDRGATYLVLPSQPGRQGYLLVHGCVPLTEGGAFAQVDCGDKTRGGRDLLDWTDVLCRRAWEVRDQVDLDWMGFLWTGWQSTFMGRVVKTFERTYIDDKSTWVEPEDPYYALTNEDPLPARMILEEFGLDPDHAVIVNGHTPVKLPKGQSPVRAGGLRLVIDGGFCRAYRKSTGIAGYTLIDDELGVRLVTHGEFTSVDDLFALHADVAHTSEQLQDHAPAPGER